MNHTDVVFWSGVSNFESSSDDRTFSLGNTPTPNQELQRPIACYQLAWWLRKHRFTCQVVEFIFMLSAKELIEMTEPFISDKTLCIAVSTVFWQPEPSRPNIIEAMDYFRAKYPKLKFVGGGPHVNMPKHAKIFDVRISGDGEGPLLSWCQEQKRGVAFTNASFDITSLEHRFNREDVIMPDEVLPIELGRGCIFKCKFCSYDKIGKAKGTYQRQHDFIYDEMKHNHDLFGTTKYIFLDDTVNEDFDKIKRLSTLPQRLGFDLGWVGYCRADLIWSKPESAELLEQSGLISPYFGIESFHKKASTTIGKGWSGKYGKEWLPHLYNNLWGGRINFWCSFILGLAPETVESMYETLKWCNDNPTGAHIFIPLFLDVHTDHKANAETRKLSFLDEYGREAGYRPGATQWEWSSDQTSYSECVTLADRFNTILSRNNTVSAFRYAPSINAGLSLDHLKISNLRANGRSLHRHADSFKDRYVKQFKETFNL